MPNELDPNGLTQEELETLAQTPIARLAIRCRRLVGTMDDIKQEDIVWEQLVRDTASDANKISSQATAEEVITCFLQNVERYGTLALPEEDHADE